MIFFLGPVGSSPGCKVSIRASAFAFLFFRVRLLAGSAVGVVGEESMVAAGEFAVGVIGTGEENTVAAGVGVVGMALGVAGSGMVAPGDDSKLSSSKSVVVEALELDAPAVLYLQLIPAYLKNDNNNY